MQLVSLYPFDPTGRATANKIENQTITVIPPTEIKDYSYVVPRGAPFYSDTLVLKDGRGTGARTLIENVDYWCVIDFLSASHSLNRRISVGVALLDARYSGTLYATYQAVGGNYSLADFSILEELIRERYIVKHVSYEQIINLPPGFAPEWHEHQVGDMVGMSEVRDVLQEMTNAIGANSGSFGQLNSLYYDHTNHENVHSPAEVGLSNLHNYGVATENDVSRGANNKYVTADILRRYVTETQFDVSGFIKTSEVDELFATKENLNNYLRTDTASTTYATILTSYTKNEIDVMVNDIVTGEIDFTNYFNKQQAAELFLSKEEASSFVTVQSATLSFVPTATYNNLRDIVVGNFSVIRDIELETVDTDTVPTLTITETVGNTTGSSIATNSVRLGFLDDFAKKDNVYTRFETDTANEVIENRTAVYTRTFNKNISYISYTIPSTWTLHHSVASGMLHVQIHLTQSFYFNETTSMLFKLDANDLNTPMAAASKLPYLSFSANNVGLAASNADSNYWIRPNSSSVNINTSGELSFGINFNADATNYTYINSLLLCFSVPVATQNDFDNVRKFFGGVDVWLPV